MLYAFRDRSAHNVPPPLRARPCVAGDREFLWQLHVATMRDTVTNTPKEDGTPWGWDQNYQRSLFENLFDNGEAGPFDPEGPSDGSFDIIRSVHDERIGFLFTLRSDAASTIDERHRFMIRAPIQLLERQWVALQLWDGAAWVDIGTMDYKGQHHSDCSPEWRLEIRRLQICPEQQGKGLGTHVLRCFQRQAASVRCGVDAYILQGPDSENPCDPYNRLSALFQDLGYECVSSVDVADGLNAAAEVFAWPNDISDLPRSYLNLHLQPTVGEIVVRLALNQSYGMMTTIL